MPGVLQAAAGSQPPVPAEDGGSTSPPPVQRGCVLTRGWLGS